MSSIGRRREVLKQILRLGVLELCEDMIMKLNSKKKRKWVMEWIKRRNELGASSRLLKELASENPKAYLNILRMSVTKFEELLQLVEPIIRKQDTVMRKAISCRTKLEITLRYLASGDSFKSLMYLFRVPHNTISKFLPDVLSAIMEVLQPYMQISTSKEEWKTIQENFATRWNFPKCCGALDGKHVVILRPKTSASDFYNYKGTYSIVLFAMVDADYCFRYIDVGSNGRSSDSTIFRLSTLNIAMEENLLNWPDDGVCVGACDDAFPILPHLLKPYSHRQLSVEERIFNYRLARARRVVENSFGILASRFRVFSKPIAIKVESIDLVVKAACSLHNWLRMTACKTYFSPGSVDVEKLSSGRILCEEWRKEHTLMFPIHRQYSSNNYKKDGEEVRNRYAKALMTDWAVPWQMYAVYKDYAPQP